MRWRLLAVPSVILGILMGGLYTPAEAQPVRTVETVSEVKIGVQTVERKRRCRPQRTPQGRRFHDGRKPVRGGVDRHSGYWWAVWAGDINRPGTVDRGTKIHAWRSGRVIRVKHWKRSYGKHVVVRHGRRTTLYAHLRSERVHRGEKICQGEVLGRVGSTGNSSGPHLHFEIQRSWRWR